MIFTVNKNFSSFHRLQHYALIFYRFKYLLLRGSKIVPYQWESVLLSAHILYVIESVQKNCNNCQVFVYDDLPFYNEQFKLETFTISEQIIYQWYLDTVIFCTRQKFVVEHSPDPLSGEDFSLICQYWVLQQRGHHNICRANYTILSLTYCFKNEEAQ